MKKTIFTLFTLIATKGLATTIVPQDLSEVFSARQEVVFVKNSGHTYEAQLGSMHFTSHQSGPVYGYDITQWLSFFPERQITSTLSFLRTSPDGSGFEGRLDYQIPAGSSLISAGNSIAVTFTMRIVECDGRRPSGGERVTLQQLISDINFYQRVQFFNCRFAVEGGRLGTPFNPTHVDQARINNFSLNLLQQSLVLNNFNGVQTAVYQRAQQEDIRASQVVASATNDIVDIIREYANVILINRPVPGDPTRPAVLQERAAQAFLDARQARLTGLVQTLRSSYSQATFETKIATSFRINQAYRAIRYGELAGTPLATQFDTYVAQVLP